MCPFLLLIEIPPVSSQDSADPEAPASPTVRHGEGEPSCHLPLVFPSPFLLPTLILPASYPFPPLLLWVLDTDPFSHGDTHPPAGPVPTTSWVSCRGVQLHVG